MSSADREKARLARAQAYATEKVKSHDTARSDVNVLFIQHEEGRQDRVTFLEASRPQLITYLKMKLEAEDWHGVQDAASDLRDLDSELDGLKF